MGESGVLSIKNNTINQITEESCPAVNVKFDLKGQK